MSVENKTKQFLNNSSDILARMKCMEEFCDVTLVSEDGERFRAHKVVLASASTLFREMFQTDEEMSDYQVISMRGIKSRFVQAMVDLIYNGETQIEQRGCEDFLNILKQYRLFKFNDKEIQSKIKCKYVNKGFCKEGFQCVFYHPKEDCESHLGGIPCKNKECLKRHRHICKYWDSKRGCSRRSQCSYLHEVPKYNIKNLVKRSRNRCYACNFNDYDEDQVKIHKIKDHKFILCLNCDFTIEKKEILLSKTFNMREVLRKEFPNITSEALDQMVNY